jgi:hypothetical protein
MRHQKLTAWDNPNGIQSEWALLLPLGQRSPSFVYEKKKFRVCNYASAPPDSIRSQDLIFYSEYNLEK